MRLEFTKMHGLGNDFVVLDTTRAPCELNPGQWRAYIMGGRRQAGADDRPGRHRFRRRDRALDFRIKLKPPMNADKIEIRNNEWDQDLGDFLNEELYSCEFSNPVFRFFIGVNRRLSAVNCR